MNLLHTKTKEEFIQYIVSSNETELSRGYQVEDFNRWLIRNLGWLSEFIYDVIVGSKRLLSIDDIMSFPKGAHVSIMIRGIPCRHHIGTVNRIQLLIRGIDNATRG